MESPQHSISQSVKRGIMRRVFGVWFLKLMAPVVFFELPVFLVALKLTSDYIFVQKVLENMALSFSGVGSLVQFFSSAFLHTHTHTQVALLLGVGIALLLVKDTAKSFRNIFQVAFQRSPLFR